MTSYALRALDYPAHVIGYWIDQAGRNGPAHNPEPDEFLHVDLAGHNVELTPYSSNRPGHARATWEESIYSFTLAVPGQHTLTLVVEDLRTKERVGSAALHSPDGELKFTSSLRKGIMQNAAFGESMVMPVVRDAEVSAFQWKKDRELERKAGADQAQARAADSKRKISAAQDRPDISQPSEIDQALKGIDLEGEGRSL